MSVNNVGGPGAVQMMSIEGLDLESMLMAVQTNRVNLLDQQLKDQMSAVQNRNNRINELNVSMNGMNEILAKAGTSATSGVSQPAFGQAGPQVVDTVAMQNRAETSGTTKLDYLAHLYDNRNPGPSEATNFVKSALDAFSMNGADVPPALAQYAADLAGKAAGQAQVTQGNQQIAESSALMSQGNALCTEAYHLDVAAKNDAANWQAALDRMGPGAALNQATAQQYGQTQMKLAQANAQIAQANGQWNAGQMMIAQSRSMTAEGNATVAAGQAKVDLANRDVTPAEFAAAINGCTNASSAIKAGQEILTMADPKAAAVKTRADAEAYIKSQQSEIDALGNSQQMDMLRLQSLSNKRNEAFEIMTNFMKKLSDSRSGIIQKF